VCPKELFPCAVYGVIEHSSLDEAPVFGVPLDVLIAHVQLVSKHELELGLEFIRKKDVIVVQKRQVGACCELHPEVASRAASNLSGREDYFDMFQQKALLKSRSSIV